MGLFPYLTNIRKALAQGRRAARPTTKRRRLQVEVLEDRTVPSTLEINAYGSLLFQTTYPNTQVSVSEANRTWTFTSSDLIYVDGNGGVTANPSSTIQFREDQVYAYNLGNGGHLSILLAGGAPSTVSLLSTDIPTTITDGATTGTDFIILGGAARSFGTGGGTLAGIGGPVTVQGSGGHTDLVLDDSGDSSARNVTINNGTITGFGPAVNFSTRGGDGLLVFGGPGGNTYTVNNPGPFGTTLYTGKAPTSAVNSVSVEATSAPVTIEGQGQGGDVVWVSSSPNQDYSGTVASIRGEVSVYDLGGGADLTVSDAGDSAAFPNVTLNDGFLTGLAPATIYAGNGVSLLNIDGGAGTTAYTVNNPGGFYTNVYTGAGNDTVQIQATSDLVFVDGQGGNDSVVVDSANVRNGYGLGSGPFAPPGVVWVVDTASTGSLALTVDDRGDTASWQEVTLSNGLLTGLGPATSYGPSTISAGNGVTQLNVYGDGSNSEWVINDPGPFSTYINTGSGGGGAASVYVTATTSPLTIDGGGGSPIVSVGNSALANIQGPVAVENSGTPGNNSMHLVVNNGSDTTDHPGVNLDYGSLTGLGSAPITWDPAAVNELDITDGSGLDLYSIDNPGPFPTYVQTNNPNDRATVLGGTGLISFNGQVLATQLSVTGPSGTVTAGVPFQVTVTAQDANGNVVKTYAGTVQFSAATIGGLVSIVDGNASLPASYPFTPADQGRHTFTVVLSMAGTEEMLGVQEADAPAIQGAYRAAVVNAAKVSVSDGGTYNGSPFAASGSAVGTDGTTPVAGSWSYTYYAGRVATGTPQAGPPTGAGTYTVVAAFTSSDPNYTGGSAQATFTITPAAPALSLTAQGSPYSGSAVGVDGIAPVAGRWAYTYYAGGTATGTLLPGAPIAPGTYTVVAAFTSADPDYTGGSTQTTFTIAPAAVGLPFNGGFAPVDTGGQLSSPWVSQAGNFADSGGAVTGDAPVDLAVLNGLSAADVTESAAVAVGPGQLAGLVARYQGPGDQNMYLGALAWGPDVGLGTGYQAVIYKKLGGAWTLLASGAVNSGAGTLSFQVIGNSLQLFLDAGSGPDLVASASDSSIRQAGAVGIRAWANTAVQDFRAAAAGATLPFTDAFAQGDGTPLNTANWATGAGGFTVQGQQAQGSQSVNLAVVNSDPVADVTESAAVAVGPGQLAGLVARYQGPGDQGMYLGALAWGPDVGLGAGYQAVIYKKLNGAWVLLDGEAVQGGAGALTFQVVQDSLKLFLDGSLAASANDGSISGPGQVGLRGWAGASFANYAASSAAPPAASLPFTDTFGTPANASQLGASWVSEAGNFADSGGAAVASDRPINLAVLGGLSAADVALFADVAVAGVGQAAGLVARYQGPGDQGMYYGALMDEDGALYGRIFVKNSGAWTLLAQSQPLSGGTGRLKFQALGSSLRLSLDTGSGEQLLASATDDTITGPGSVGIRGWAGATFGNFSAS